MLIFKQQIELLIKTIPNGFVTTYGDLAAMAGKPLASRIVGGIAHYGDPALPWHRVVNRNGGLARGFPGGPEAQRQLLENEGLKIEGYKIVNFNLHRWRYES